MRLLSLVLAGVLLLLQVPLWIGKGSWCCASTAIGELPC